MWLTQLATDYFAAFDKGAKSCWRSHGLRFHETFGSPPPSVTPGCVTPNSAVEYLAFVAESVVLSV